MAQSAPPSKHPVRVGTVMVLLTAGVAGALWVPIYARTRPKLGEFPFFYWYQLVAVPAISLLCWICYLLLRTRPSPGKADDDWGGNEWTRDDWARDDWRKRR
jgi:hypothetical protein